MLVDSEPKPACDQSAVTRISAHQPTPAKRTRGYIAIAKATATAAASVPARTRARMSTRRRDLGRGISKRPNPWLDRRVKLRPERCGRAKCGIWKCGVLMAGVLDRAGEKCGRGRGGLLLDSCT